MNQKPQHASRSPKGIDPAALLVALILLCGVGGIAVGSYVKSHAASPGAETSALLSTSSSVSGQGTGENTNTATSESVSSTETSTAGSSSAVEPAEELPPFDAKAYFAEKHTGENSQDIHEPLLIGDSVAAGATDAFYEFFPYGLVDAVVSRNIWESPYPTYRDEGTAGKVIIFCLGTNNAVVDWQIDDELLNSVEDDKVVFFVNTRCTEEWVDSTNHELAAAVERHPNLVGVIDWYSYSEGHDEWFAGDGTHLTEEGARIYMGYIYDNVTAYLDKHPLSQ